MPNGNLMEKILWFPFHLGFHARSAKRPSKNTASAKKNETKKPTQQKILTIISSVTHKKHSVLGGLFCCLLVFCVGHFTSFLVFAFFGPALPLLQICRFLK